MSLKIPKISYFKDFLRIQELLYIKDFFYKKIEEVPLDKWPIGKESGIVSLGYDNCYPYKTNIIRLAESIAEVNVNDVIDSVCLRALDKIPGEICEWDCRFMYFPDRSLIKPHIDELPWEYDQSNHSEVRFNILIEMPSRGGNFYINGELVDERVGDAVMFDPFYSLHEMTTVFGNKVVLSIGAIVKHK